MKIVNPTAVLGENIAAEYLVKKGYRIIERNFRKGYGEIDIIAIFQQTLIFVEVKTRRSNQYGNPLEAITYYKLKSMKKTAEFYKYTHRFLPEDLRLDAISIILSSTDSIHTVEHIENISV